MFQAGGLVVVVVEIFRRSFLASMVPVIVNAVLNEHQVVIDIVSFVIKGDFHRSRLGEKQRGKILAGWVTRKMRTIAQYSIRDPNGSDNQITEVAEPGGLPRTSTGTFNRRSGPASINGSSRGSMRGVSGQMQNLQLQTGPQDYPQQYQMDFGPPAGLPEMPGQGYPESIPELATGSFREGSDDTPTEAPREFQPHPGNNVPNEYHAIAYDPMGRGDMFEDRVQNGGNNYQTYQPSGQSTANLPPALRPGSKDEISGPPQIHYNDKPYLDAGEDQQYHAYGGHHGEAQDSWYASPTEEQAPTGGGLRITNRNSSSTNNDDWAQEAIMHMNFAGSGPEEMRRLS